MTSISVLQLLTSAILLTSTLTLAEDYPLEVSAGFYADTSQTLPPNYERVSTLVYRIQRPDFNEAKMSILDYRCDDSSKSKNYTCVVFFEYQKIVSQVKTKIMARSPIVFNSKSPASKSKFLVTPADCHLVRRHFQSLESSSRFSDYHDWLDDCLPSSEHSTKTYQVIKHDTHFNPDDLKASYQKIVARFVDEFNTSLSKPANYFDDDTIHGPAAHLQVLLTTQSQLLSHYQFEAQRWEEAIQACISQRLPLSLFNLTQLTSDLTTINQNLEESYELTFSPSQISFYASQPLTDCTFVNEGQDNFVVRLQVPVRKKTFVPKLVQVSPLPFLYRSDVFSENKTSEAALVYTGYGSDFSSANSPSYYLADLKSGKYVATGCSPKDGLCFLDSEAFEDSNQVSCVSAALRHNLQVLYLEQPQQCFWNKQSRYESPVITETKPGVFHIVATSKDVIKVHCRYHDSETQSLNFSAPIGAFEVTLGCGCELQYEHRVYRSHRSCLTSSKTSASFKHLVPLNFFAEETAEKFKKDPTYNVTFKDLTPKHMNTKLEVSDSNGRRASSNASPPIEASSMLGFWIVIGLLTLLSLTQALFIVVLHKNSDFTILPGKPSSRNGFSRFELQLRSHGGDTEMTDPVLENC